MGTQELKYKEVYNWVLDNINSGALKVGEKLPSENELSERFGLSRQRCAMPWIFWSSRSWS